MSEATVVTTPEKPASIWRSADFVRLWGSQNISLLGTEVTGIAIPFLAVVLLQATPIQVGILTSARYLPYLLAALPAGIIVDRFPRRTIMILANLLRGLLLGAIPVLSLLGVLQVEHLYVISFVVGLLAVPFDLSWQSYIPTLVTREQLHAANSQLMASGFAISLGGPGLGGVVVQVLTAPLAIAVDAASYLIAAVGLLTIRLREKMAQPPVRDLPREVAEGFRIVFGNVYLRTIAFEATSANAASNFVQVTLVYHLLHTLGFNPATLGILLAGASAGAMVGAFFTDRLTKRIAFGHLIVGSMVVGCTFSLLLAIPVSSGAVALPLYLFALAGNGFGIAISSVTVLSLRQAVVDPAKQGRMNAVYRMFVTGFIPVGAFLGGLVTQVVGAPTALVIGVVWWTLSPLIAALSPVRTLKELPQRQDA